MSLGRRLGRLARGFVSNINDERLKETVRVGRERGETLKNAFGAAWRGAAEEWRAAEERASRERAPGEQASEERAYGWRSSSTRYVPRKYPPEVLAAYHRLGLDANADLEEVRRKRRELVKRYHPDRFVDPEQRKRAEKLTAEINAAHDMVERYVLRS
ncbi:MAG: J domain-containing protein [Actinomycetota bacterium]|nr:J domain-containing protein [Actinomycetota bacterium]